LSKDKFEWEEEKMKNSWNIYGFVDVGNLKI